MDRVKKSCCTRAAGWAVVGIVIATAWGLGNLAGGMTLLEAFAVPAAIAAGAVGVIALALLDVRWFSRLCACPGTRERDAGTTLGRQQPSTHGTT
jgi:hypothetical protein